MIVPTETFPASIPTTTHRCDFCGHERPVAHVRIASEVDTWLLCVACIRANHTDDEVRAALAARRERGRAAACRAQEETATKDARAWSAPEPFAFTRDYAIAVLLRNWNQEEIDDRQCERLCAAVHAGHYDDALCFYRAEWCARRRHAARHKRSLGPGDPCRRHRSGMRHSDLQLLDEVSLRLVLDTVTRTITGAWGERWRLRIDGRFRAWGVPDDWQVREWRARYDRLARRYLWLTGRDYQPPVALEERGA